ncbi:type II toxin-antitoxin system VapC family toxin [Leptodesmis sp.]|uniref:type II toxin-antitoxin system VapC family toxin n=1 Tax=Leptodesmis sp. TaxID=3100501 RepID=UPI00405350B6
MKRQVLLDTGPLVALIDRRDHYHAWATKTVAKFPAPFLSCEAVLSEACFLLGQVVNGKAAVMGMVEAGHIKIPFHLEAESDRVNELLTRYQSVPMSLADACLVRMAEMYTTSELLTLDSDFTIYRKTTNQPIPALMPET